MMQQPRGADLVAEMTLACGGVSVRVEQSGRCVVRIGHGAMKAGELCENAKTFIFGMKSSAPHIYRHVAEFTLVSSATAPIRLMEAHITH